MKPVGDLPQQMVRQMREAFFDVASNGVLTYQDPCIGHLANPHKQLEVVLNRQLARFELRLQGAVEQVFELGEGVVQACHEAFGAYFRRFEALCRGDQRATLAA